MCLDGLSKRRIRVEIDSDLFGVFVVVLDAYQYDGITME
jgi:hypothetical protein